MSESEPIKWPGFNQKWKPGPERTRAAVELRKRYDRGATIRALMAYSGKSYCFVRRLLAEAGTKFRPVGKH